MKNTIILILTIFSITACKDGTKEIETNAAAPADNSILLTDDQIKNSGISLGSLERKKISETLTLNGKVEVPPQNFVTMSAPMGGYMKTITLMPGMAVRKGEVLFTLEDTQYIQLQQDYLTAKARLAFEETEFRRQKELNQSKSASDKSFELAQSNYQTQLVLTKSLEEKLRLIGIKPEQLQAANITGSISVLSPINGYISKVNANTGKYIQQGEVIAELVDDRSYFLHLTAFDKDIAKLKIGQQLQAYSNVAPEKQYPCEIFLINNALNQENAGEVYARFNVAESGLMPGMFMNAGISIDSDSLYALPVDAVVSFENKNYVFLANGNNRFELKEVATGADGDGFVSILNAEEMLGKTVVTSKAYTILMAMKNTSE
jgi:cobalt-zinc-cadmium efflux system membrane fusion protein